MIKKLLCVLIASILTCAMFSGCFMFEEQEPQPVEKVQIKIDSDTSPTLNAGETYKLLYTCSEEVTITCNGKFNYITDVFTADRVGKFEIKLTAGEGEARNEAKVTITVVAVSSKSELSMLINSVSGYVESDYSNYQQLAEALERGRTVIADEKATQVDIDSAFLALQSACNNLQIQAFGSRKAQVNDNFISYGGENYYKVYYTNFKDVSDKVRAINLDTSIKLFSVYDGKIKTELKKFVGISAKELAEMDFTRGTAMAEKVFDSYYAEHPDLGDWLGTGSVVYDVLDANGKHIKNEGTGNKETDFWTLTSFLSLMVRLDTVSKNNYQDKVDKVIDAMAYHRGTRSDNTAGENGQPREFHVYGVHRSWEKNGMNVIGFLGRESVFDDQIWAAQEFLNAYNLYKDTKYLDYAVELTEYIYLVGRCETGGIYWGQGYTTRHACSSAPFVKLAVMLSEATGNKAYLDWAKDVYDWTYNTLRDKSDNLYYDLIGTRFAIESNIPDNDPNWPNPKYIEGNRVIGDGTIDKKKYSYNSGSMISAGVALYKATRDSKYLNQAKATAESCRKYFGKTNVAGYVIYPGSDGGTTYSWFDLILFKGYFDLYSVDKTASVYLDDVQKVYDHDYAEYYRDGFMPTTGLTGWTTGRNSYEYRVLMDHATNAEVMLLLGQYKSMN